MKSVAVLTGEGAFALFFRPHPREFAIQGKKNANAEGSGPEGGGGKAKRSWNWLMHKLGRAYELELSNGLAGHHRQNFRWVFPCNEKIADRSDEINFSIFEVRVWYYVQLWEFSCRSRGGSWELFELRIYRKSSINPPGGLFISNTLGGRGLIETGAY